ncbi:UPF0764 protein C16orf89 isoform 4 [Schistosoma japonicum]|uniref:UPF0764 protein C16orf89 isoform 4 n=2 Tax=Schistosoma japonicum TaxID=6182 RepID=A0A4Z2D3M1_SCHJA|nr:UPF0764 protein C16orf89 isoform 4 [Schistosoma japonicum]TNN11057.1 UPF0764 protein C16orf89 isoform 4 [Schistosoma japonicum]TNN11059.1 UPF0764 protein C16orf89 isoform 4 [Schistosoma japonicum]TNN11060.1 UPF0764 protein C16orf89 isoform 4 [Schistosoma japonicum]
MLRNVFKLIYILLFVIAVSGYNPVLEKLDLLLLSSDRLVSYYEQHVREFNFDGIFGLIPLKGALESVTDISLYQNYEVERFILSPLIETFMKQLSKVEAIIKKSAQLLKDARDPYYIEMGELLKLKWAFPSRTDLYNPFISSSGHYFVKDTRNISTDDCIIELLNSRRAESLYCHLSNDCVAKLLNFKSYGYELTHQVLYILISYQIHCSNSLNNILSTASVSLEDLKNRLCSIVYEDFVYSYLNVQLTASYRDILLEQVFVCGNLGYGRFIQLSILKEILSWQQPSGCFTTLDSKAKENELKDGEIMLHRRQLLTERRHADGCLSHMTSLAAAVIGLYLREFFIPIDAEPSLENSPTLNSFALKALLVKSYKSLPLLIEDDDNMQYTSNENVMTSFKNHLIHVKESMHLSTDNMLNYTKHLNILFFFIICILFYLLLRRIIIYCRVFNSSKSIIKI